MDLPIVYSAMRKQAVSAKSIKDGAKWIGPVAKHFFGKAKGQVVDKADDAARLIGRHLVKGKHALNSADDAARISSDFSKALAGGSATDLRNAVIDAERRMGKAKSSFTGAKKALSGARSQAEYADNYRALEAAKKELNAAKKGLNEANKAQKSFAGSAAGKNQAKLRNAFYSRSGNEALYDRYGKLVDRAQVRAGRAVLGGAAAGTVATGTTAFVNSNSKKDEPKQEAKSKSTESKKETKAAPASDNQELRKELPPAEAKAALAEKSEPAAKAAPAKPEGWTEAATNDDYRPGSTAASEPAETSVAPKTKGINPEWAGLGAGALGATGLYAGLGFIPALKRRKLLRAMAAVLGGAGIGYGAYSLAQPKTASYNDFKKLK